jgi:hypothetical protein
MQKAPFIQLPQLWPEQDETTAKCKSCKLWQQVLGVNKSFLLECKGEGG